MFTPILVAYATQYGSTREVAEEIAAILREEGFDVDIEVMNAVVSLTGYRAVVLGAPFYMGRWHSDARDFLKRHRDALIDQPVGIFALGPVGTGENEVQNGREQLIEEMRHSRWLHPIAAEMFGGKYDPDQLGLFHKMLTSLPASPLHNMPANDLRDWEAIRAWARDVARMLKPAVIV